MTAARAFHSAAAPQFPSLAQKTRAPWPVWKHSTAAPFHWAPIAKEEVTRNIYAMWDWVKEQKFPGMAPRGLKAVMFALHKFQNRKTGALFPAIATIAKEAGYCWRQTKRFLDQLKAIGVIGWQRRKAAVRDENGRFAGFEQQASAYWFNPSSHWKGYKAPPPSSPPADDSEHPIELGQKPWAGAAAPLGIEPGDGARGIQTKLEGSPDDPLAVRLASMGARLLATVSRSI